MEMADARNSVLHPIKGCSWRQVARGPIDAGEAAHESKQHFAGRFKRDANTNNV